MTIAWDALRTDTTFAPGAELAPRVREVWDVASALPGWFTVDDCAHFALVLELQAALGVRGDLLEIGAYHGRAACVLAYHARAGERVVLCDRFDTCGDAYPDQTTPERLRAAVTRSNPRAELEIQACDSSALALTRPIRFAHVDGDHTLAGALADLRRCAAALAPGGVIAVDDYHHRDFPEVTPAVDAFLAEQELRVLADVNRHGAVGRKLYLARAVS
jgi:Methyltransferase domain